jgi:hypothetical protein
MNPLLLDPSETIKGASPQGLAGRKVSNTRLSVHDWSQPSFLSFIFGHIPWQLEISEYTSTTVSWHCFPLCPMLLRHRTWILSCLI